MGVGLLWGHTFGKHRNITRFLLASFISPNALPLFSTNQHVKDVNVVHQHTSCCFSNTHTHKVNDRETGKLLPEVRTEMTTLHTPIATSSYFFCWTWLHGRHMTQLSSTASTCEAQWKMWLLKVLAAICTFLNCFFHSFLSFQSNDRYSSSHWLSLYLIWQIWLLFAWLRMMLLVRKQV